MNLYRDMNYNDMLTAFCIAKQIIKRRTGRGLGLQTFKGWLMQVPVGEMKPGYTPKDAAIAAVFAE